MLRLLDCCLESDGAVALVITSSERQLPRSQRGDDPRGSAGLGRTTDEELVAATISGCEEIGSAADQLWSASERSPADIGVAILYDHFLPMVFVAHLVHRHP